MEKFEKSKSIMDCSSSEWDESKHPRDAKGKFVFKARTAETIVKDTDLSLASSSEGGVEDISSLLGVEYSGYKGQPAVEKLLKEKQGHIKGAFHRGDIGDIDLIWGNDLFGLQHILIRREEQGIDVSEFVKDIADVVENGEFIKKNERGNFELWHNRKMAVISPELRGNKITYLLTAFKKSKK